MNHSPFFSRRVSVCTLLLIASVGVGIPSPCFGAKPPKAERREMKLDRGDAAPARDATDPAPNRAASKLREQMDVTDDGEWDVISQRIASVTELRRLVSGGAGARGVAVTDKIKGTARADRTGAIEQDALRIAVRDKLPDAEIKARLARAHDVHRQNEAKLQKAQEELRAVLTVRQEAVAVVMGLLPP
jgi:hypothetical protein